MKSNARACVWVDGVGVYNVFFVIFVGCVLQLGVCMWRVGGWVSV